MLQYKIWHVHKLKLTKIVFYLILRQTWDKLFANQENVLFLYFIKIYFRLELLGLKQKYLKYYL